jgi:hypothetical protein
MKLAEFIAGFGALLAFAGACEAQNQVANSDAIVLVAPSGNGATVTITFPNVVSHESVKQRIAKLGRIAGWTLGTVEVKDEEISTRSMDARSQRLGKQTGATMFLPRASLARDGGFVLQPFVQAFSDLRRIEVLYFIQKQPKFLGLREFSSRPLDVKLLSDGGPYRYAIDIKEQGVPLPNLPLVQPSNSNASQMSGGAVRGPDESGPKDIAFVVTVAAACGLVVLAALLVLSRYRSARPASAGTRRINRF